MIGGSGGGGEKTADTGALTGSAASAGAAVKVPGDWSELERGAGRPRPVLSDPKAAAPGGKDGGTAVVVGTVEEGRRQLDAARRSRSCRRSARCRSPAAPSRSAAATCRPTATTTSSRTGSTAR